MVPVKKGLTIMSKKEKEQKSKKVHNACIPVNGVYGLALAFVVASIAFSSYVVCAGTSGLLPKALLIPQMVFAATVLLYKFAKN